MAFCFLFYFFDRFFYHNKETKHNGSGAHNNDNIGIAGFTCFGTFQRRSFFLTFVFWNGKRFECLCINCPALCAGKGFDAFRINRWFRCNTAFIPTMIFCNGFSTITGLVMCLRIVYLPCSKRMRDNFRDTVCVAVITYSTGMFCKSLFKVCWRNDGISHNMRSGITDLGTVFVQTDMKMISFVIGPLI